MIQIPDTAPGPYYVSVVRDGGSYRLLAGPYDSHMAALADVEKATKIAMDMDPKAVWYAYGTVRTPGHDKPGILNHQGFM